MSRLSPTARLGTIAPGVIVFAACLAVFWRTAYPTITWWDSSGYSTAAATLGITSSPGSLVLVLLGWLATRIHTSSPAHVLNLLAGAITAATALGVYGVARRLGASALGAAAGAIAYAFAPAVWEYAVQFTPYALSAFVTSLLWAALVIWWQRAERDDASRWLGVIALLIGIDFSVHRTNALMVPGIALWVLMRAPRVAVQPRAWLAAVIGFVSGLSVQLLVIPIARHTSSPMVMLEPNTWARFWDYISLAQVGGGFLVDIWPRKAPLVSTQLLDLARAVREMGWLMLVAAIAGVRALWQRDRRLALAFVVVVVVQACVTVLYFNIPASYFRSLHRHYLPVLVGVGIASAVGLASMAQWLARWRGSLLVTLVPVVALTTGWRTHDASKRWFARDFASNSLTTLPAHAIMFTAGDNDTFPLWYAQYVEGERPDVRVVNLSLLNAGWYQRQVATRDSTFPKPVPNAADRKADSVVHMVVERNAGRVPLCFSTTVPDDMRAGLDKRLRVAGLHACVTDVIDPVPDVATLHGNLIGRHRYRGYADVDVIVDDVARNFGALYVQTLDDLLRAEAGDPRCLEDGRRMSALVPPVRVGLPANAPDSLLAKCQAPRGP